MWILKNIILDALIFGAFADFDTKASDVNLISTNVLENGTQLTTFEFTVESKNTHFGNSTELHLKKPSITMYNNIRRRKKVLRANRRRTRKRRIDTNSTLLTVDQQINTHQLKPSTQRKILKRRKFRNRKRKQKIGSNILEITTAKGVFLKKTQQNETINKLIAKLNNNPEDNFDEFKSKKHPDKALLPFEETAIYDETTPKNISKDILVEINNGKNIFNRCKRNRGGCSHICHPKGKTKCSCLHGFFLGIDQRSCFDIDECKINNGQCETECVNLMGSYICRCPEGLALTDDKLSCQDINECLLRNGHGPCQDTCYNTFGSYSCSCKALNGTKLGIDGLTCEDVNECLTNNGGCSHICINTFGTSFCSCPNGMLLSSDWKTCQDVNECEDEDISKNCKNCINTLGSYICPDVSDIQSDQSSGSIVCKPLFPPPRGFISCTRKGAFQSVTRKGRKRTVNSPGTICKLICPVGYRIVGEYFNFCGVDGEWEGNTTGKCIIGSTPLLQCPSNQHVILPSGAKRVQVKFPSPITDVQFQYVRSKPRWAKDLEGYLTEGEHDITFTVKDPNTRLFSTCSFKVIVETNSV